MEIKLKNSTGNRKGREDEKGYSFGWTTYETEVIEGWSKGFIMHALYWFPFYKAMRNAHWLGSIKANFYQYIYIIINNKIKASVMWETVHSLEPFQGLQTILCSLVWCNQGAWLVEFWRQLVYTLWGWQVIEMKGMVRGSESKNMCPVYKEFRI